MTARLLILPLLALAFAGCNRATPPAQTKKVQPAPPGPLPSEGLEVGNLAPEITGTDLDGQTFSLSDYRGKVVMLDFWGHW